MERGCTRRRPTRCNCRQTTFSSKATLLLFLKAGSAPCAAASPRLPDPERLRGPDISFVSAERIQSTGGEPDRGWFRLVPDVVVEIDSPRRRPVIEQRRIQDYLEAGVRLRWVLDDPRFQDLRERLDFIE
jgi:Uma2 family endonuclease